MRKNLFRIALAVLTIQSSSIVLNVSEAYAKKQSQEAGDLLIASPIFTEKERQLISDFFDILRGDQPQQSKPGKTKSKKGLPPGLAKKKSLPPGLAKQLERKGTLPPGLAKRDLPYDLERKLPHRKSIFERIIVGDDILLIERGTRIIMDILRGAARN